MREEMNRRRGVIFAISAMALVATTIPHAEPADETRALQEKLTSASTDEEKFQALWDLAQQAPYHRTAETRRHARRAAELAEHMGDKRKQSDALRLVGGTWLLDGEIERAMSSFRSAAKLCLEEDLPCRAAAHTNIGLTFFRQNNYPRSLHYYYEARDLCRKAMSDRKEPSICRSVMSLTKANLASTLTSLGQFEEALRFVDDELDGGNDRITGATLVNKASILETFGAL